MNHRVSLLVALSLFRAGYAAGLKAAQEKTAIARGSIRLSELNRAAIWLDGRLYVSAKIPITGTATGNTDTCTAP